MRRLVTIAWIPLFIPLLAIAQSIEVEGTVSDRHTLEPIPFANVQVTKGHISIAGTATDFNGLFKLTIPANDTFNMHVRAIGYESARIDSVMFSGIKSTAIDFYLPEKPQQVDEIIAEPYYPKKHLDIESIDHTLLDRKLAQIPILKIPKDFKSNMPIKKLDTAWQGYILIKKPYLDERYQIAIVDGIRPGVKFKYVDVDSLKSGRRNE